jgi:hypothetical protein
MAEPPVAETTPQEEAGFMNGCSASFASFAAAFLWDVLYKRRRQPNLKTGVLGNVREILVRGQHCQVVANAQLRQKRVDRPDLHALSAAAVPQLRRIDVIVAIRHDERQRGKAIDDLGAALGPEKPCSNSCRTSPVVRSVSPLSRARTSIPTSAPPSG